MKLAIHGYGNMGRTVERVARESGHDVVCILGKSGDEPLNGAEVLIDFSHASALDRVVRLACDNGVGLVLGTTGWNERLPEVRARVEKAGIGCVYASNFSPGANVTFALARRAGELFARFPQYAAGIEERHHARKKDAPSGTAIRMANEVKEGSGGKLVAPVASSRVGAEFGLHTLFFDSPDDLVEISHRARGREGFARGAVLAAEMVVERKGMFRFDELMFGVSG
jgi:4-hydroxy-tetrahydrodipicolinate reductase